jgi:hypothetical protein
MLRTALLAGLASATVLCAGIPPDPIQGSTTRSIKLDYKSDATNGRTYSARSQPHQVATEVKWTHGGTILFSWSLPANDGDDPGGWVSGGVTPDTDPGVAKTKFGYGLNGDEFNDGPDAYVPKPAAAEAAEAVTAWMKGKLRDKDGKVYDVDVHATSSRKTNRNGSSQLAYRFESRTGEAVAVTPKADAKTPLRVRWSSAASSHLADTLKANKATRADAEHPAIASFNVDGSELSRQHFEIVNADGKVLASLAAPAFRPKGAVR